MALTAKPTLATVRDDGTGTLKAEIEYTISTDAADAVAAGIAARTVLVTCEVQPQIVADFLAQCVVVDDGGWPTKVLPLPLPRKA